MKIKKIEKALKDTKFCHLTERELLAYRDQKLDKIFQTIAEAHLQICLLCEQRLQLLKEERLALENHNVTTEDTTFVRHVLQQTHLQSQNALLSEPARIDKEIRNCLATYLEQITLNWQADFMQMKVWTKNLHSLDEVWRWQSEDKILTVRANLKQHARLVFHLFSSDLDFSGVRLRISINLQNKEVVLRHTSGRKLHAQVEITDCHIPSKLADISIEIL